MVSNQCKFIEPKYSSDLAATKKKKTITVLYWVAEKNCGRQIPSYKGFMFAGHPWHFSFNRDSKFKPLSNLIFINKIILITITAILNMMPYVDNFNFYVYFPVNSVSFINVIEGLKTYYVRAWK